MRARWNKLTEPAATHSRGARSTFTLARGARWLVAALTLQLAADIIETSISSSWQTIGRAGAIAVIRTFPNYFLERDVEQQRRQCATAPSTERP